MKNLFKKTLTVLFLFVFTSNGYAYTQLINRSNEKIKISERQVERFKSYLKGNFYSYSLQVQGGMWAPLFFALSDDGNVSAIVSCYGTNTYDCNHVVEVNQIIEKAKKETNKDLKIIAIENILYDQGKKIPITNQDLKDWNKFILDNFVVIKSEKNRYFDTILDKIKWKMRWQITQ